jgi:hypothetical protein
MRAKQAPQFPEYQPEDALSPEQREEAIAEILSNIALRIMKQSHESDSFSTH